jgi:hypothetical protein
MFKRLQEKWKVSGLQFFLILCTFALGGSATGWLSKKIMNHAGITEDWWWAVIYILLVTALWPVTVIAISIPFGQFRFFKNYIKKLGVRLGFIKEHK